MSFQIYYLGHSLLLQLHSLFITTILSKVSSVVPRKMVSPKITQISPSKIFF